MIPHKYRRIVIFPNLRIQVFVQFILIFLLILSIILFSSNTFYISMIESSKMFEMRESAQTLQSIDLFSDNAISKITEVETNHNVLVEIYSKNEKTEKFTDNIYSKYYHSVMFNDEEMYVKYIAFFASESDANAYTFASAPAAAPEAPAAGETTTTPEAPAAGAAQTADMASVAAIALVAAAAVVVASKKR